MSLFIHSNIMDGKKLQILLCEKKSIMDEPKNQ